MNEEDNNWHFETESVHSGLSYNEETGAVIPPIFATSTFESDNQYGFDYTRSGNPNFRNLEEVLKKNENAKYATVFASGVSAITSILSTLNSNSLVLAEENVYGCTYRLMDKVFSKFGVTVKYSDLTKQENIDAIADIKPDILWIESPTNPMLKVLDIKSIAKASKAVGANLVVDNTFASSFIQCPLDLGADLSLLSLTKYANGHSDALGGVVCSNNEEWADKMVFAQKALGLQPSPFDCWLIQRGLKTQSIRVERHSENAEKIASYLTDRFPDRKVIYPFLESHPQYNLALKQMRLGSGIITVDLGLDLETTKSFLNELKLFAKAESLGGIESLVCHPASMTHASVPKSVRESVGISDSLFRLSVGIENSDDLIKDICSALKKLGI